MDYAKAKLEASAMGETNDCAVKAIAIACDVSYKVAHRAMELQGRRRGGPSFLPWIVLAVESLGFRLTHYDVDAKTVTTLERDKRVAQGFYMAIVRGHILAIKDGKVQDWTAGRRHRIQVVFRVEPSVSRRERRRLINEFMK